MCQDDQAYLELLVASIACSEAFDFFVTIYNSAARSGLERTDG